MYILGISCYYHDSSACLLKDGTIIAAAEEERFNRIKHDISFPLNAIKFCMDFGKISIEQIDFIAFYEKPLIKFERILFQHLEMFPKSLFTFYSAMPSWINEKLRLLRTIKKKLKYKKEILFVEHHLAHAASSYLVSPFDEAAILTIDGVGEWATTSFGVGKKNKVQLIKEIHFPHSLGLLYSAVTAHLGFSVNNSEYKVMGLSAYGNPEKYYDKFKRILKLNDDGSFSIDMDYFDYHYKATMPGKKFQKEFGPIRKNEPINQHYMDIAAALQKRTEDAIFNLLRVLYAETKMKNLCIAGGVGLNSVANGKIIGNSQFKSLYIQPASGDAGTSIGAAAYVYYTHFGNERSYVMDSAYLGPEFKKEEIKKFLDEKGIKYSNFSDKKDLIKKTSKLIMENNVVGWFQGRMEWGPRALGNRSILANPTNPEMKQILNLKVKHREQFRPFAPAVCIEDAPDFFKCDNPVPLASDFMLMVYPIKEEMKEIIPSVVHVDGSGRLQTVRKEQNPLFYSLIKEFGKISGIPILINTSFNIRGEPIVCTPNDAYKCMMGTGIDYLVMDSFLIKRDENSKDRWDSEKIAKD